MATVSFRLNRPDKSKEGEPASVLVQLYVNRDIKPEIATGEKVAYRHWKNQRATSKAPEYDQINKNLNRIESDLLQLWRENVKAIDKIRELMPAVVRGTSAALEKKSLFPTFKEFIKAGRLDKDVKTVRKYSTLHDFLEEFNPELSFLDMDLAFYDDFRAHLYTKDHIDSTVDKYLATLKTFLNWADDRGHKIHMTKNRPTHRRLKFRIHKPKPISLTIAELEKLESLNITLEKVNALPTEKHGRRGERTVKALTIARDYFILECRTGQRISDVKAITAAQVDENLVWTNHVTKGARQHGKVIRIPLNTVFTAPAYRILQKYNFKLPKISEKALNENIKTVCQMAGIDKPTTVIKWRRNEKLPESGPKHQFISTHTGRKTFITIGLQYMEPKLVKDIAGITWDTLKHYEGEAEDTALINGLNSMPKMKIA